MTWDVIGMGAVCSLGETVTGIHEALCAGRSGLAPLSAFDVSGYRARSAYEVTDRVRPGVDEPLRATRWLIRVIREAMTHRPWPPGPRRPAAGTGRARERMEGSLVVARAPRLHLQLPASGLCSRTPAAAPFPARARPPDALFRIATSPSPGEASTAAVAGNATTSSFGGFDRIQAPPPSAIRVFDRSRSGMIMGEGAAAVVLRRTGAHHGRVYGRVRGVSMNCDAGHPTAPDPAGIVRAIEEAHQRSAMVPADIDFVIVHGTGTPQSDLAEAVALNEVFKAADPGPSLPGSKPGWAISLVALAC